MSLDEKKSATTIPVDFKTTVEGEALASFTQLIETFYYFRANVKILISFHALVPTDPAIVAEATAASRTVNQLTLNGDTIETVTPPVDTEGLDLKDCEKVKVLSEFAWTDAQGDKDKAPEDSEVMILVNSATGEL